MAVKKQDTPPLTSYQYGKSPNPTSWYDTADILKANQKGVKKPSGITDKLEAIQKLLGERK